MREHSSQALDLLLTRRSVVAKKMIAPGPSKEELETILTAGLRVPDHGKIGPWRIEVFDKGAQAALGDVVADIYASQTPEAEDKHIENERMRPQRTPVMMMVVSTPDLDHKIPQWEQVLSAGAVCQNILVAAHASGYVAQWLSDWIAYDDKVRAHLGLAAHEKVAGFIYIGSAAEPPKERTRPTLEERVVWK